MLNPKKKTDHLLYGDVLTPPENFPFLDCAVATTYSLDIQALISCMIPLAFGDDVDSKLFKNRISVLSSLEILSKKLIVFCDPGQIKIPQTRDNEFAILLENIIVPVKLPKYKKTYPSFHPKMWLLRFSNKKGEAFYRLIILSRNISYDKMFDISIVLESDVHADNNRNTEKTRPIIDYFDYLKSKSSLTDEQKGLLTRLIKMMKQDRVCFEITSKYFDKSNYEIIPIYHDSLKNDDGDFEKLLFHDSVGYNKILLISPFVKKDFLSRLKNKMVSSKKNNFKIVTRQSSLDEFAEDCSEEFDLYTLNPDVVSSDSDSQDDSQISIEEEVSVDDLRDIHAKLYLLETTNKRELVIGSANATNAAFQLNHELVIRLCSKSKNISVQKLFDDLNTEKKNFLIPYSFSSQKNESNLNQKDVENVLRAISHIDVSGIVKKKGDKYELCIHFSELPELKGTAIFIKTLSQINKKVDSKKIVFEGLKICDLSEFFYISVEKGFGTDAVKMERIVKIMLKNLPYQERKQNLLNEIIKDKQTLSEYIALLLSNEPILTRLRIRKHGEPSSGHNNINVSDPLYEILLQACVSNPKLVMDLDKNLKLVTNKDIVSDELRNLYRQFLGALQKEGLDK